MTKLNQILDEDEILVTFPIIDDVIKAMGMQGDKQQKISESEVLTVAFISHRYFGGNYKATLSFLNSANQSLFNNLLSKSRFMRRLHRWFGLLPSLFHLVSELKRKISLSSLYFIDSFPVSVCENIRIKRSKLVKGEKYRGYIASKRVYFYGLKVHIVCDEEKFVHEFVIVDGRTHDLEGWANASFYYLSEGDKVIGDKAYMLRMGGRDEKGRDRVGTY